MEIPVDVVPDDRELTAVSDSSFYLYFLRLGALGFGGPIALAGFM